MTPFQNNSQKHKGTHRNFAQESVTVIAELPESGLEVTWLKDNIPLSMTEGTYETINKDCSYQLIIPEVTTDDGGEYKVRGGEYESTVSLTVNG